MNSPRDILSEIGLNTGLEYPELAQDALQFVRAREHPAVFNHSLRTCLYARHLAAGDDQDVSQDALFAACLFHDAGTVDDFNGDQRFEIEGADAAARFLDGEGWSYRSRQKAPPATWPGEVLRAHLADPDSDLPNRAFCPRQVRDAICS